MMHLVITGIEHIEHTGDLGSRAGTFVVQIAGENLTFKDENGVEQLFAPKSA